MKISEILRLAIPISIQSLVFSCLGYIDIFMVSKLGEANVAAIGIAAKVTWLNITLLISLTVTLSIFLSNYVGSGNVKSQTSIIQISLLFLLTVSTIQSIIQALFSYHVSSIFTDNLEVSLLCSTYLKYTSPLYLFSSLSLIIDTINRCHKKPSISTKITILEVIIAVFLNWVMIYGNLSFPEMGIIGAALSTTIARIIRTIVGSYILVKIYTYKYFISTIYLNSFKPLVVDYFSKFLPILLTNIIWSLGIATYQFLIGKLGVDYIALHSVVSSIESAFLAISWGVATSSGILVARRLGYGYSIAELDRYLKKQKLSVYLYSLVTSVTFFIVLYYFSIYYNVRYDFTYLLFFPLIFLLKCISVYYLTILQNCGDTKNNLKLNFICQWLVSIPISTILIIHLNCTYISILAMLTVEELLKVIFLHVRLKNLSWIDDVKLTRGC